MLEFIQNVILTILVSAAIIGVVALGFFAGSSKNSTDTKMAPRAEVLFRSKTIVLRRGKKVRIIKEYDDDRWEI